MQQNYQGPDNQVSNLLDVLVIGDSTGLAATISERNSRTCHLGINPKRVNTVDEGIKSYAENHHRVVIVEWSGIDIGELTRLIEGIRKYTGNVLKTPWLYIQCERGEWEEIKTGLGEKQYKVNGCVYMSGDNEDLVEIFEQIREDEDRVRIFKHRQTSLNFSNN